MEWILFMNAPLPRSRFGKKFAENFEKIFRSKQTEKEQINYEDEQWKQKVTNIAKGQGHDCKPALLADNSSWCCSTIADIMSYLYAERNWKRLKDTCWGIFIRETTTACPDLLMRQQAREQILDRMR